jgi:hypothetical protein
MPKKKMPLKSKKNLLTLLTGVGMLIVVLLGLAASYVLSQRSQDQRSDASVKKGLAEIVLDVEKPTVANTPVIVRVYLKSEANLESISLKGDFDGVKLSEASFQPADMPPILDPSPGIGPISPSEVPNPSFKPYNTPIPLPVSPVPTTRPKTSAQPVPTTNSIIIDGQPVLGDSDTAVGAVKSVMVVEKNITDKKGFELVYKLTNSKYPLVPQSKLLIGWFTLTPQSAGNLRLVWKGGNKATIFNTKVDTLTKPEDVTIVIGDKLSCQYNPAGSPICPMPVAVACRDGLIYQPGPENECGCQTSGSCVPPKGTPVPVPTTH